MNPNQPDRRVARFRSRNWVLNQATEQELLEYLDYLVVAQRAQQEELMSLVEEVVRDHRAMRDKLERVTMEAWLADDAPRRTSWLALGIAGLLGYSLGRRRRWCPMSSGVVEEIGD